MTERALKKLACELSSLCVFRDILENDTMKALLSFLSSDGSVLERMSLFGQFVYSLSKDNYSFSDFLCRVVYTNENSYVVGTAQKTEISEALRKNAKAELKLFSKLTELTPNDFCDSLSYDGYIPKFSVKPVDFRKTYEERLKKIDCCGYGIFSSACMFRVNSSREIVPVEAADDISLDHFIGYEEARNQVLANTQALVEGRPAANVLLFGDAGTGKSSTVKACANHFYDRGVRLIELRKDQLFTLSKVMGKIGGNPLKFIIFIDDLSFNKNDDNFSMLKAALEGSASARADNAVIYATSNRRHIVKETFSERGTRDDIHHGDTVQELLSLSERFGLQVYFEKPNKQLYLDIIHALADKKGIELDRNELDIKAEAFALSKASRSPRAAEQFIDSLMI
ncbi:MAG: ATP-binding protein [Lachnospiraceae bacterium]|jgi:predicted AAA+ superfamily ATPase